MTLRHTGLLAVAALFTAHSLSAATVAPQNDLRFIVAYEDGAFDLTGTASGGGYTLSSSEDEDFDTAWHIEAAWIGSNGLGESGGLLYGVGLLHKQADREEDGSSDTVYTATGVRAHLGWGYAFTPRLQLEILPYLSLGAAQLEFASGNGDEDWDGLYVDAGLDANLVYAAANGFELGGGIGVLSSTATFEDELYGVDWELDIEQTTATAKLFLGVRF